MLTLHQRTEIIRETITERMKYTPQPGDLSFSELKNCPELLIWGFPEGTIFNIVTSYYLYLKQGYTAKDAICEIEALEENRGDIFPTNTLTEYVKYRLQKEHAPFVYLYSEELLHSFQNLIKRNLQIYECEVFEMDLQDSETLTKSTDTNTEQVNTPQDDSLTSKDIKIPLAIIISIIIGIPLFCYLDNVIKEKMEFKDIYSERTLVDFIHKYPNSKYDTDEICNSFLNTAIEGGIPALKVFITNFKDAGKFSEQYKQASLKLKDLCEQMFAKCLSINTIDCWDEFIQLKPPYLIGEAQKQRSQLKDELMMDKIHKVASHSECMSLLHSLDFEEKKYTPILKKKCVDLYVKDFLQKGEYASIAKLYAINKYDITSSTIVFINNMYYDLSVCYSGKVSAEIIVKAGKSFSLTIPNGSYQIVVVTKLKGSPSVYGYRDILDREEASPEDLLLQKIFVGSINVNGGLYKTTYPIPSPKNNVFKPSNTFNSNNYWPYNFRRIP